MRLEWKRGVMDGESGDGQESVSQSDISLVGTISHEGLNLRCRWMAVSGMMCRRS